jgi:hypothetical protein
MQKMTNGACSGRFQEDVTLKSLSSRIILTENMQIHLKFDSFLKSTNRDHLNSINFK